MTVCLNILLKARHFTHLRCLTKSSCLKFEGYLPMYQSKLNFGTGGPALKRPKREDSNGIKDHIKDEETKKKDTKVSSPVKGNENGHGNSETTSDCKLSPDDYDPSKSAYNPVTDACWSKGSNVPYMAFAKTMQAIEETSSRLSKIEILSNFLQSIIILNDPDHLIKASYLCLNKVAPDYEGLELGVGDGILLDSLAEATGRSKAQIKSDMKEKGDMGLVAQASRSTQRKLMFGQKPKVLTILLIYDEFRKMATTVGKGTVKERSQSIVKLLRDCRGCEARYLIRSLGGKLRIGLAETSLLQSLAYAKVLVDDPKLRRKSDKLKEIGDEAALKLKTVYVSCPNYDKVIPVLLEHGFDKLTKYCSITPGVPMKPMLAHPSKGINVVMEKFSQMKFTCEYKYDGERAQIHCTESDSKDVTERIRIYSRNQENNTSKYPDLISLMPLVMKPDTKSFILDCEAVAWDSEAKQILPFQVLSHRKRKDVKEEDVKIHVCLFAFDILYYNGEALVTEPLRKRRQILHNSFDFKEGKLMLATAKDFDGIEEATDSISEFLEESIQSKCEGLMVKTLDEEATYEIARRSHSWLKLKKDYLQGVGDSVDVVVIGAYHGKGKRTGSYGGFLLACYNPESEEFQAISKIGTGFTDDDLATHHTYFSNHIIERPKSYYRVSEQLKPDVWLDATQVWEVKCADLSLSPVYTAAHGLIDREKGISLRFPRFIRIREDKKPDEATSSRQVANLYRQQESVKEGADGTPDMDDEFY